MDTEQIRDFLAVARHKNFSKAAEELYIGQPALSRRISCLERQMGVQLFLRNSKAVELTQAGEILQKEAQHIMDELRQLEEKMHAAVQGTQGRIQVTAIKGLSAAIKQTIRQTIAALPNCEVDLDVLIPTEPGNITPLMNADVAFLLGSYPEHGCQQKHAVLLEEAAFSFLLPKNHPLARLHEIRPSDLAGETLLLLKVDRTPAPVQGLLQEVSRYGACRTLFKKNPASISIGVELKKGIGFLPCFEAENSCRSTDSLTCRPAAGLPIRAGFFLAWADVQKNPAAHRFIHTFLERWNAAAAK